MKRVFALFLVLAALLCAVSCTGKENEPKESETNAMTTTAPETEPNYYVPTVIRPSEHKDAFKLVGRTVIGDKGIQLDWSWAEASFRGWFDGEIRGDFDFVYSYRVNKGVAVFRVVVDGDFENAVNITIEGEKQKLENALMATVEKGYHTISVYKCSQALGGGVNLDNITFTGTLDAAPEAKKLNILVIGDSISCGAGAVDTGRIEAVCDDSYYSYGALLSRNMDADVSVFAISGWGIACGGQSYDCLIPAIFDKTNALRDKDAAWDFSKEAKPDVVIVSLGTNDYRFATEGRTPVLIDAATKFLKTIRDTYPESEIIWIYGQMLNQYDKQLENMVNSFNDAHMSYYTVKRNVAGGFGHPDAKGHEEYAAFLEKTIKEKLGL